MMLPEGLPDCWGHRGASASFPENTLASFEAAIRDGAEGIESDVHVSIDDVVIMFHDADLSRTTGAQGKIKDCVWYGPDGMEHLRTKKEPQQSIPTFAETVILLMQPENSHVLLNVDVKPDNEAKHTFTLMERILSAQPDWETALAPRILLGLWHPSFIAHAKTHLPHCPISHIGVNVSIARQYFWEDCETFSMAFSVLANNDGQKFLADCQQHGKRVVVWTVNRPDHMLEAVRWGVDVIMTDTTKTWLELRDMLQTDYERVSTRHSRLFLWTNLLFYNPVIRIVGLIGKIYLESVGGPLAVA